MPSPRQGPLAGIRVVEFNAKGPVPYCTKLLLDMGAEVVQIMRSADASKSSSEFRYTDFGKAEVAVDLKEQWGLERVRSLLVEADVLVEGFRPGVLERLGLGPERCMHLNPRLIYARITGWGQSGARAQLAGHDINYLAATGALDAIGTPDSGPVPPLNLVADFAGGSLFAAMGICAAVFERSTTGKGRVLDIAMVDGVLSLMTSLWAIKARGDWEGGRGQNFLDGGAPYYGVYATSDDRYMAVGAMERQFRVAFFRTLHLPIEFADRCDERSQWKEIKAQVAISVRARSQAEWVTAFEGVDACVTAVATLEEALRDADFLSRGALLHVGGHVIPGQTPKFSTG